MRGAWSCTLLIACSPSSVELHVPPRDGTSAIVVAVGANGGAQTLATDFTAEKALALDLDGDANLQLYVAYYECSLAWLGVPPAGAQLSPDGSLHPWTRAQAVWAATEAPGTEATWRELTAPDPELERLRLTEPRADARCEALVAERIPLPGTEVDARVTFAIALDDERALFGFDRPVPPVIVERGGTTLSALPAVPYLAGVRSESGELFIVTTTGAAYRGDLARGFVPAGNLVLPPALAPPFGGRLVVSRPEEPFELYLYSITSALERYDGERWEVVAETEGASTDGAIDLLRLGPAELLVVPGNNQEIFFYQNGNLRPEIPRIGDKTRSAGLVPGFGPLAGTEFGRIFERRRPGDWQELSRSGLEHDARAFAPFGNGFITGGGFGGLTVQYHPEQAAYCPLDESIAIEFIELLPMGPDLLAAPRRKDGGHLDAVWLHRPKPFPMIPCR
ncbi:MAG: hypothetical protein IPG45_33315 [Deltaproteobacteria bacterium]|nr:hypothetical protein [Deltaproteobacteria bacterium]